MHLAVAIAPRRKGSAAIRASLPTCTLGAATHDPKRSRFFALALPGTQKQATICSVPSAPCCVQPQLSQELSPTPGDPVPAWGLLGHPPSAAGWHKPPTPAPARVNVRLASSSPVPAGPPRHFLQAGPPPFFFLASPPRHTDHRDKLPPRPAGL